MSRDRLVAELVDRLVAARFAELVAENRALHARLAAERARRDALTGTGPAGGRRPDRARRLTLVQAHADEVGA